MSENVTATMNGTQSTSSCFNPTATRIGETFAYCLLFLVSLVGNTFIAMIVFKTKTLRRPFNFLTVNMAMSDLLVPIFLFPRNLISTFTRSWLIGGPLGQVLCKLSIFVPNFFLCCVYSKLSSNSGRPIWSCDISPPFPADWFKAMPVLHSRHLDHRYRYLFPIPVRLEGGRVSGGAGVCDLLEWRIRRVLVLQKLLYGGASCKFVCPFGFYRHSLLCHCFKNQIPENSRRATN